MGKDRCTYKIECKNCGIKDELHMWDDDWLRWGWTGMEKFRGKVYVTGPRPDVLTCKKCGANAPSIEQETS